MIRKKHEKKRDRGSLDPRSSLISSAIGQVHPPSYLRHRLKSKANEVSVISSSFFSFFAHNCPRSRLNSGSIRWIVSNHVKPAAAITSKGLFRNGKNKGKNANAPFQRDGAISALRGALDSILLRILLRVAPRFFFFSNSTPSFFFRVIKFMAAQRGLNLD